jgi:hypothetical protein
MEVRGVDLLTHAIFARYLFLHHQYGKPLGMRYGRVVEEILSSCGGDIAEWLEPLTGNAKVATVLGSIPTSSDTVQSEGLRMKQC